jgi:hypothetical protein
MSSVPVMVSPDTLPENVQPMASPCDSLIELRSLTESPSIEPESSRVTKSPVCVPSMSLPF